MDKFSQADINQVVDLMMKNPGVPVDASNFPDGMTDAISKEIDSREQHHKVIQDAIDHGKSITDKQDADQKASDAKISGYLGGASWGAAPQLAAVAQTAGDKLNSDDQMSEFHDNGDGTYGPSNTIFKPSMTDAYRGYRQDNRRGMNQAHEADPHSFELANLLGAFASPFNKALPSNSVIGGMVAGGAAGLNTSDADLTKGEFGDAALDTAAGGLIGGTMGAVAGEVSGSIRGGLSALAKKMAGDFWDPVLLRAMFQGKEGSDMITKLRGIDAMPAKAAAEAGGPGAQEVTGVVRANSKFPYLSPQATKDAIQNPKIALGARGTINNPIEMPHDPEGIPVDLEVTDGLAENKSPWTPQPGPPKEIDLGTQDNGWVQKGRGSTPASKLYEGASTQDLNGLMPPGPEASVPGRAMKVKPPPPAPKTIEGLDLGTGPAQGPLSPSVPPEIAPLSPAERMASQGLSNMSNAPSNGMDPASMMGGIGRMLQKNIAGPTAIGIPKAGEAMLRMLEAGYVGDAAKAATLKAIVSHVMSSPDPSFSDYLAKETSPEYNALYQAADKEDGQAR